VNQQGTEDVWALEGKNDGATGSFIMKELRIVTLPQILRYSNRGG
jgi:hypothetical protein